ncbi:flagellar hook capping FlgD N-terminal domain-containing protein [Porcipelethomonas sp.]|uniref:flagellar hook capping FlgD N-terminal domain-containing protein n=1 Tax=Porcipelethomonas sp. TaxID=2981675 RepID=UPI003EF22623
MSVGGVTSSDRNYIDMMNGTGSTGKVYNAVFEDKDESSLSINDFFDLMITQLTNQDFMDPVDDTEYLAQMAQFCTMQEMMDLCQYSKQNYVMGMLGQEVTVSKTNIGGTTDTVTGKVEKIVLENDDFKIYIDGKPYDYSKVTQINSVSDNTSSENNEDNAEVSV